MTKQEKNLWYNYLRKYPVRTLRQKVIKIFIVDFYCRQANLVIELDGGQHYTPKIQKHDMERTNFLESIGLKVIRFNNTDITNNFSGVCTAINIEINKRLGNIQND